MKFLIDFGIKGGVALGIGFLIAIALRRSSASIRYAMWTCALAAVLLLPLASWIGPRWNLVSGRRALRLENVIATSPETPGDAVVVEARRTPIPEIPLMIWMAGVLAMLARVVAGHLRVRSLFGAAQNVGDASWLQLLQETARGIAFRRTVALKRSTATDVPLSYGLLRATVLLPGGSEQWTQPRLRIVLTHEMIHARRLDSLWGLLAQCALAVNWFNPLAWFAVRQFRREQERSCDDAVVSAGTASTVYATHLVDLARSIAIPEPALGMAERFDLEGRVHALLDPARKRSAASGPACAAMFLTALALMVPLAAVRGQAPAKLPSAEAAPLPAPDVEQPKQEIALHKPARRTPAREEAAAAPEAQATASLAGSVYDPSGAVVPRATITLTNTATSNEEGALSGDDGSYKLEGIPAGEYLLKVRCQGFAIYQKTVTLEAGTPAAVNLHLALGEGNEAVFITGARPVGTKPANDTPQRIRVGGMVEAFNLIRKVTPQYPPSARAEGVEGTVLLRAIISKTGSLLSIVPVSSSVDPRLVSAAKEAVSQWQYQPTLLNGEPVEVITTITVSFRLN